MVKDVSFLLEGEAVEGRKVGVLLIHGLTGTPNEMRITAKGLNRAGCYVYAMQIAGHCGDEADLNATTYSDWYQSVVDAAQKLKKEVDHLFVGGLSMGAVLALKLAAEEPKMVDGVICYATTFKYDGWSMPFYAKHFFFLLTWFKRLGIFQDKKFAEEPPYGLKDEKIRQAVSSSMLDGDSAAAGLANNPYPALAEMLYLSRDVKAKLPKVTAPTLIMHSSNDDIASVKSNAKVIEDNVSGPTTLVLLEDSYHLITIDRERKFVIQQTVEFINETVGVLSV
ncbi:alpha/beta hydrolase [Wohlfahrtiimonas larvae]|uniref:Alpha/beta fold hydrolase n=3 Tax=Wohlfahrtiimonas larvae TaxID=1157986 RepID=A0ABP9MWP4_9GAMM